MTSERHSTASRQPARIIKGVAGMVLCPAIAWAFGALHFDCPLWPKAAGWLFLALIAACLWEWRAFMARCLVLSAAFVSVLAWWLTLQPRRDRDWQSDVSRQAWAEIKGDLVTIHGVRNFDYLPDHSVKPRWETRTMKLSSLTGIDIFINYWGSPWMSHPIVSFQFSDAPPLAMSIETRKENGESYSAIGGFYRQFELILIAADERDVIRLRTNMRKGEDGYLYRTTSSPAYARERFLEYLHTMNDLNRRPRWYHAITSNCTTAIRAQHPRDQRAPWDWRMLVNGKADEMLYERGHIHAGGLSFAMLKERSHVNRAALAAEDSPGFSRIIRRNLPAHSDASEQTSKQP